MAVTKAQKDTEIVELNERFSKNEMVVVAKYSGLTVAELTEFRAELRKEGATFKVTKNTLAKRALKGTKFEGIADMFAGPTGIAASEDPLAAARAAYSFAKKNDKFVIVGGGLGDKVLSVSEIEFLAKLPSKDEIRAKLIGVLQAPASKLVGVLQAPARNMVGVTKAYAEKA